MAKATTGKTSRKPTTARAKTTKTRARATTTRKSSASLKDASVSDAAKTAETTSPTPSDTTEALPVLRKRELIEAVVMRSGVKKRDVKPAVEAALAILGETLAAGQGLNLPELGKLKIQNSKSVDDVQVVNLRLRRKLASTAAHDQESEKEGLAEPAE
ncbi:HU family DNA-binding protein [Shimia sp. R10_1]|uniref:HU family DNA-binding protein n=1 Tax=Shimia sp. R10_1 TaxID=2821095 RepID=UPI001FFE1FE4|nr:HU family DNA-binding protein [Shimia sp. R10_1]